MELVRLYTDEAGDSRFEDVRVADGEVASVGEFRALLSASIAADDVRFCRVVREGSVTVPHNAGTRQLIIHLTGAIEVETSTAETRRFGPGSVLLAEDMTGKGHITRGLSEGERLMLVIELPDDPAAWPPARETDSGVGTSPGVNV